MNILCYLLPKESVIYVFDDATIRQTVEKMTIYGYTAIPILNHEGNYVGTIAEGDILRYIKTQFKFDYQMGEKVMVRDVKIQRIISPIRIDAKLDDLIDTAVSQNFVPVIDDLDHFIGIITRKDIITNFIKNSKKA